MHGRVSLSRSAPQHLLAAWARREERGTRGVSVSEYPGGLWLLAHFAKTSSLKPGPLCQKLVDMHLNGTCTRLPLLSAERAVLKVGPAALGTGWHRASRHATNQHPIKIHPRPWTVHPALLAHVFGFVCMAPCRCPFVCSLNGWDVWGTPLCAVCKPRHTMTISVPQPPCSCVCGCDACGMLSAVSAQSRQRHSNHLHVLLRSLWRHDRWRDFHYWPRCRYYAT